MSLTLPLDFVQGTIAANGGTVVAARGDARSAGVQVSGSFNGTLSFFANIDGATWQAIPLTPLGGGAAVSSVTAAGVWTTGSFGGLYGLMVEATSWTSGSAVVTINLAD